jgi:hypothetical protein
MGIERPESILTHRQETGYQRALSAKNYTGHRISSSWSMPACVPASGCAPNCMFSSALWLVFIITHGPTLQ